MINPLWFKEDREQYKGRERDEQIEKSKEALLNSTFIVRRLKQILEDDLDKTFLVEEDFDNPAWERNTIAAAAERKVLRRIIRLLP